ncbi:MAG: sugar phosphate isomerase/epimerase [Clostridia bacterium]|nr:sugar phosphate isomerase/epimerase [Oscillospiraceae bacterium]MBQ5986114.1 sugar phosphate isomerase/epimerase [Clostridia bacterium]MBQ6331536.1 sugar phosphate isomerase/epimerase [Clostridia bacterium]
MPERLSLMTFTIDVDIAMKKMTARECLQMAADEGLQYVDVRSPSGHLLKAYSAAVKETGVKVLCYIAPVSFFSNGDETIRKLLTRHLETAAALGASLFMIVPVNVQKDERICRKLGKAEIRQRLKKYFTLAISFARDKKLTICFETTPQDYTCLSGIEDCRWVLEAVPDLKLVYDTANMLPHGDDPILYYEALKEHIVHTHLKDVRLTRETWQDRLFRAEKSCDGQVMKCCLYGEGVIPLREILSRMESDGYEGTFALEFSHPEKYPANLIQNTAQFQQHLLFLKRVQK